MQSQAVAAEEAAMKKVNKVKTEMRNQLQGFVDMQNKMELYGMIVEAHAEDVDKVYNGGGGEREGYSYSI